MLRCKLRRSCVPCRAPLWRLTAASNATTLFSHCSVLEMTELQLKCRRSWPKPESIGMMERHRH